MIPQVEPQTKNKFLGLTKLIQQNSFQIMGVYGLIGILVGVFINYLGEIPTWVLPGLRALSFFGTVVVFDVIIFIYNLNFPTEPIQISVEDEGAWINIEDAEYDPHPFESGGRKQGFMWFSTVILMITTDLPLTVFILPCLSGLVLAFFYKLERQFYSHGFWIAIITVAIMSWQIGTMLGYWRLAI